MSSGCPAEQPAFEMNTATSRSAASSSRSGAVNVSKAALEGEFADELAPAANTRLYAPRQESNPPHPRATSDRGERPDGGAATGVSAIQQKMDKLDEAFLHSEVIEVTTYGRQRDWLREELRSPRSTITNAIDELDVQGILAFAERILPRASDLWVRAWLDYKLKEWVTLTFASWNQIAAGRQLDRLGRFVGDASSEWL